MSKKSPNLTAKKRVAKNQFVTKSGNRIKLHRNIGDRLRARKEARAIRRAERLRNMPKSRMKRILYRLNPKNAAKYWFSRDGGIMFLKLAGIGFLIGFMVLVGLFAYFRKDLPDIKTSGDLGGSVRYYDRTGQTLLWEDYDAIKRIPVDDNAISPYIKDATVAIEDRDFYSHNGFNTRGIIRAAWNNAFGGSTQGGSTITQQLVKLNEDWTNDRSYSRKIKEIILAVELERTYTKADILDGYLNSAPYNGIDYGVEAASRSYFQKSAKDLTLDEAAFLAAIPKAPSYYSPYSKDFDKEAFIGREQYILDIMFDSGKITKEQRDEAKAVDVLAKVKPREPKYSGIKAPYFVLAAKEDLESKYGSTAQRAGWKVTTTVDLNLQGIAEDQVAKGMKQIQRQGGDKAAFVAEDVRTGQIVAMVGGPDFTDEARAGQLNYATQPLPPGSSFKPYDYTALINDNDNFGAGSVLYDTQGALDGYPCTNKAVPKSGGNCLWDYDLKFPGPVTLRYALGGSRNIPAVKSMLITGIDKTIETAQKLGLKSGYKCYEPGKPVGVKENESQCYSSSAIGDGAYLRLDEHVHGYASISRNGVNLPETFILKIEDSKNKVIDEWKETQGDQVVRPEAAYIVADMLSDPNASYFSNKIHRYKGHKFGLKTGTTNDAKDGWLMGFSTYYAAGVWVGNHTGNVTMSGFMETMTTPIWQGWMDRAHDNLQPLERAKPSGLQTLPAFIIRNHVGLGSVEPSPSTDLFPSWYKPKVATTNKKQIIDVVSNKLATDCTPDLAKKELSGGGADAFSGDPFVGTGGANTEQTDDVHKCDDEKPHLSGLVLNGDGSISVTAFAGTHPISSDQFKGTVNFISGGQIVQSFNVGSDGETVVLPAGSVDPGSEVSAQVIDSVLYSGDSPNSVTSNSSGISITGISQQGPVNRGRFTWSDYSGATSYQLCFTGSGAPGCVNTGDTNATVTFPTNGTFNVFVKALFGVSTIATSASQTFAVPGFHSP